MATLITAVRHFMENHGIYDNLHDVELVLNRDDSLIVATDWPGETNEDGFNIEIYLECKTIADLICLFQITTVNDLKNIKPAFLMNLFEQGKADICCAIDSHPNYYPMHFRKVSNSMMAKDDENIEHEVSVLLETPQQFRDYTQQCYLLDTC